jgi:hypothetical protein
MKRALTFEVHAALTRCAQLLLRRAAKFQLDALCSFLSIAFRSVMMSAFAAISHSFHIAKRNTPYSVRPRFYFQSNFPYTFSVVVLSLSTQVMGQCLQK